MMLKEFLNLEEKINEWYDLERLYNENIPDDQFRKTVSILMKMQRIMDDDFEKDLKNTWYPECKYVEIPVCFYDFDFKTISSFITKAGRSSNLPYLGEIKTYGDVKKLIEVLKSIKSNGKNSFLFYSIAG